jgi:hypothetical protein
VSIFSRKRLGLSASVLAVGLVATTFAPGTAEATSAVDPFHASAASLESIQKAWSSVPEYASAPALATGRLTDPKGQAMAGATVVVMPVPNSPKVGQRLIAVARATTNSTGGYTIRLPAAERPLLRPGKGDDLNLHIMAIYPDAVANWFVPVRPGTQEAPTANLVLRQVPRQKTANATTGTVPAVVGPAPPGPASCVYLSDTEITKVPMVVGYKSTTHAADINYAKYTYTSTAAQTSGVGLSLTTSNGGFSVDGTTEKSSGVTMPFPTITGESSNYMTVYSTWNDAEWYCAGYDNPYYAWVTSLNAVNTEDGTPGAPIVAAGHCSPEAPGVPISYTTTTQSTWSEGVNLSDYIGIDLSSQDGWTGSSALTYDLAEEAPICGVSNTPNSNNPSAGYLQVH